MNKLVTTPLSALSLALLSALAGTPAAAANDNDPEQSIEHVVVTSDFRGKSLQTLAASVSVLSEALIESRQAQHLEDVFNVAANVNFASGASRGRFVQIRGIGERSQFAEPINPSVGFVVDDFDFSGIAGVGTLFDVEQVEILRGPQATEFGANAMAGMVKVKTTEASAEQSSKFAATLGQNNTWALGAATGGALAENLFIRVAAQQYKSDGFIENIYLDRKDTSDYDEFTTRVKLKYQISDDASLDFSYQRFDIDNGYDDFSLDNDGKTRSDQPGFDRHETDAFGVKWQQGLDWGQLVAIVNHSKSELAYGYDEDWTFVGFHPWEYSSTDHYFRDRDTSSVDVRVLSNQSTALFSGKTSWVIGVYAQDTEESLLREYTFAEADFSSVYEPTTKAIYLNTETQLTDKLSLQLGLRGDNYEIDYRDSNGFTNSTDDTMLGGKMVLDYAIDTANVYVSVSRGYKAGGFNPDERVSNAQRIFAPEYNWNYEVGVKGRLPELNGVMRVAAFYMDREDTQISDFDVQIRDDGTPDFIDIIDNADVGKNWGMEVESSFELTDDWRVDANIGYLRASFKGYQLANGTNVAKQDQAQAPKYTFNLASEYFFTDSLSWRVEADGKDAFRFSDGHDELSRSYVLINTNVTYQLENWQLSLWAKNLFDREYYVRGFGGFSNDPRDEYATPEPYFQLGNGRQAGITVNYNF